MYARLTGLLGTLLFVGFVPSVAWAALQTHTNSLGIEFVLIPAGTFQMGCGSAQEDCAGDEKPQHRVRLSQAFYLGKYEVTQAQWETVMGSNPSQFKGADRPVERVNWDEVQDFIRKLNAKEEHMRYRLPTEAEWEYAARAGSDAAYGSHEGKIGKFAWHLGNAWKRTHPVGRKQPNTWGLYDMHGNVNEWVADWYGKYPGGPVVALPDEARVFRGGGWSTPAKYCRAASRHWGRPDIRSGTIGFRLALAVEE